MKKLQSSRRPEPRAVLRRIVGAGASSIRKGLLDRYFRGPASPEVEAIRPHFDRDFYLASYPDLAGGATDPVEHFHLHGWREWRDPSPDFSTQSYLVANPDIAAAGIDPFWHYVVIGKAEGRPLRKADGARPILAPCPQAGSRSHDPAVVDPLVEREFELSIDKCQPAILSGWAVDQGDPDAVFEMDVLIDGTFYGRARNDLPRPDLQASGKSRGQGGFKLELPLELMEEGQHEVSVVLPNGRGLAQTVVVEQQRTRQASQFADLQLRNTAVIVPVYNAAEDLAVCIERLIEHTPESVEIVLIDDASTDPAVPALLARAVSGRNIRVLRNEQNLGFTRTVNRGIAETGTKDVVLLNSDARVTPGWIEGMLAAARSRPRVATVTAMSDRAGAFSAPEIGNANSLPPGVDEIAYARAFRLHGLGLYPLVPTGNGFCMFVRRACIDEVGALDAAAFPRGYGEENDFCMRAGRAGWRHVIDDCTYVFHERSKSFGEAKTELIAAGRAVVDSRYPEYNKAIGVFQHSPEIGLARFRGRQALRYCSRREAALPKAMFVVSTQTGGTPQTNLDLMAALGDALDGWLLRCDSKVLELSHVVTGQVTLVRRHLLSERVDPVTHRSTEYDSVVESWIRQVDPKFLHIRHMGWHSLALPKIAKSLGKAVILSFHDFYTVCPTIKLLDDTGSFCGGRCTASTGTDCRAKLWEPDSFPELKNGWVKIWQERFAQVFEDCDEFVTTSSSARERILSHFPGIPSDRFRVIPHGRDFREFLQLRQHPSPDRPLRILVPGNIDSSKGLDVILDLLRHDVAGRIEFHVAGSILDVGTRELHPRLIDHGPYKRDSFADMVAGIAPDVGAVFSIWDETYCHTLTELWSVGLPALVLDFPTVAGRVQATGCGWVLRHHDIPALYDRILRIAADRDEQARADDAVTAWQAWEGSGWTTRAMASEYLNVYRAALGCQPSRRLVQDDKHIAMPPALRVAVVGAAEWSLDRANASTEIRLWERTRNGLGRTINYIRFTPPGLLAAIRGGRVDAAIIQRTAIPVALVPTLLKTQKQANVPYIFDLDDDLLNVPAEKDPQGSYAAYAPALRELVGHAEVLTVSTPQLVSAYRGLNPRIHLMPNRLSGSLWGGLLPERVNDGVRRALYMGTLTHQGDLAMIRPALEAVAQRHPEFRLGLVGVSEEDLPDWIERIEVPSEAKSYASFVPWLREKVDLFDFALAPLEDTEFSRSKSPLKVLDYAALGLPVLCSDTPVYRPLGQQVPFASLVPNTTDAWTSGISRQISRGRRSPETSEVLRAWVFEHHLLEPTLPDFDALVGQMVRSRSAKADEQDRLQPRLQAFT